MGNRICPICDCKDKNIIKRIKLKIPKEYRIANNFDVASCKSCGFCFADTISTKEDYEYYYKNFNNYSDSKAYKKIFDNKDKVIINIIEKLYNKEANILNIGIGNGHFEKYVFNKGYLNILGLDPSVESVKMLKQLGIKAVNASIYDNSITFLKEKFDVVLLIGTLEHLYDVKEAVARLDWFLKSEGIVIIAVPNVGSIQDNTTNIPNNFNHEHINYFSRISLINLFNKYKYEEIFTYSMNYNYSINQESEIISVFKKNLKVSSKLIKDNVTSNAIKAYFDINESNINLSVINKFINTQEEILVWGTGAYVMSLIANYNLDQCNILYYIDNNINKQNNGFNGRNVKAPKKEELEGKIILICSMLYANDIVKQINEMKINCQVYII